MSTAHDGETTPIVDRVFELRRRFSYLWQHAQHNSNNVDTSTLATLGECNMFLDLWLNEHIDLSRSRFWDDIAINDVKMQRIRRRVEEAYVLVQHCEKTLKVTYPERHETDAVITEDSRRHDCFVALERTLRELKYPTPIYNPIMQDTGTSPSTDSASPPRHSPHIATVSTPAPSFTSVYPAYSDPQPVHEEISADVKEEQETDQAMEIDSTDRAHFRHDSHIGSQGAASEVPTDTKLPSISSWQMPASLAQVPATRGFDPILPRPPLMHNSPSMDPASSPPPRYHSGSFNGNDHIVMMSPSTMLPPLQSPFIPQSNGRPLVSLFDRPHSRPNGSSPEH